MGTPPAAMAATSSERDDGKRRGSEREWRGSLWRPPRRAQGHGARGMEVERCSCMAATHGPRVTPLRHSTERLAGDGVGWLDRVIGLVLVRTKSWALKQVCCPHDDLQISLTDHGHLSNGLAVIRLQIDSVSALIAMNKSPKLMVKTKSNECHLFICSSP